MPRISANLNKIANELNLIKQEAKEAQARTKALGNELKFNPNDVNLIVERYKSLGKELDAANKNVAALKKKQAELNKEGLNYKEGTKELDKINAELDKVRISLTYAESKAKVLNDLASEQAKNQAIIKAVTSQVNDNYVKHEKIARRIQLVTLAIVRTVRQWTSEAAKQGTELYTLSKRYNMSAEEIQNWDRALELATGQSGLFSRSLKELVKTFAEVASGRGIATENVLKDIGLAYKDIAEMSSQEQFHAIIDALQQIENASLRASYAEKLFKEAGIDIAGLFNDNTISLDEYLEKAKEYSVISNEGVKRLAELNFEMEASNIHLQVAKAELVSAMLPAIRATADILRVASPLIQAFGKGMQRLGLFGNILVGAFTAWLLLMPMIVTWSKQHTIHLLLEKIATEKLGQAAVVTTASLKTMYLATGGIGLALGALSLIVGLVGSKVAKTNESLEETTNLAKSLMAETGGAYTANTEQYATSNKEYYMQAEVNIHAEGDSAVSDESAIKVAQFTADQINKNLGDLVK